jgi:hypothetical protein
MVGSEPEDDTAFIAGDGDYAVEVVSEIRHQERLEWLAQGRGEEPAEYDCTALLVHEPDNPFDPNAVSVSIDGVRVGYLPPNVAAGMVAAMRASGIDRATCDGIIEGGWYRNADDKGDFCLRLDINADFARAFSSIPLADRAPPLPIPAVAPANARNTVYDLVLGAAATVAMLAALGAVWLFVQSESAADRHIAVASPPEVAAASPPVPRDWTETTALAVGPARSSATGRTQATAALGALDKPARPIAAGSAPDVSKGRAAVAATEAANDAAALASAKPASALPSSKGNAAVGAPPSRAEIVSRGTLTAPAAAAANRAAIAPAPLVVPEIDPLLHRAVSVTAAPVAVELDPVAAAAIFQSALPPLPKPAPPKAAPDADGSSEPAVIASREAPEGRAAAASRKRDARARANARARRALTRSRAAKARSRYSTRYTRRQRQTVEYGQEAAPTPQAAPAAAPAPPPRAPFNSMANQMIQGLAKEWSTQALPASSIRPRSPQ